MAQKYLIRLDDACPTMDKARWGRMEEILDRHGVKPMVGVIPHNEDPAQQIDPFNDGFWNVVKAWESKGWAIALHGYNHCYSSNDGMKGLNPMWSRSEFAGLPLEKQREKIRQGVAIMHEHGINPKYFFAPSHTFDENTLKALCQESVIRIISDTIGRYPYKRDGFLFIPQIIGRCTTIPFGGIFTFCTHPNSMSDESFRHLDYFIKKYKRQFIGFSDLNYNECYEKRLVDRLLSWAFFTYRSIRGLK